MLLLLGLASSALLEPYVRQKTGMDGLTPLTIPTEHVAKSGAFSNHKSPDRAMIASQSDSIVKIAAHPGAPMTKKALEELTDAEVVSLIQYHRLDRYLGAGSQFDGARGEELAEFRTEKDLIELGMTQMHARTLSKHLQKYFQGGVPLEYVGAGQVEYAPVEKEHRGNSTEAQAPTLFDSGGQVEPAAEETNVKDTVTDHVVWWVCSEGDWAQQKDSPLKCWAGTDEPSSAERIEIGLPGTWPCSGAAQTQAQVFVTQSTSVAATSLAVHDLLHIYDLLCLGCAHQPVKSNCAPPSPEFKAAPPRAPLATLRFRGKDVAWQPPPIGPPAAPSAAAPAASSAATGGGAATAAAAAAAATAAVAGYLVPVRIDDLTAAMRWRF